MNSTVRPASPIQHTTAVLCQLFDRAFFRRMSLALLALLVCFQFQWYDLRFLTSEAVLRISMACGLSIRRVAFDELGFRDNIIQFGVACTWINGLFGIVPLLRMSGTRRENLRRMAIFIPVFFVVNVVRIQSVVLLYQPGASWDVEHGWITGLSEFLVYLYVLALIDHPLARLLRSGKLPSVVVRHRPTAC